MTNPLDELRRRVSDLEHRVNLITLGGSPGSGNFTQYGPNVISNGDIESGSTGWSRSFWTGTLGTVSVETTAPLDGLRSLKISEAASSSTRITWLPSGNATSPTVGTDVFATSPGDVWLFNALMQSSVSTTHAKLYGFCGNTPPDCFALQPNGGATTWVAAVDVPLTAGVPTTLSGTLTVPTGGLGYNYIAFNCSPDDAAAASGVAWSWWLDNVSLQKKIG